MMMQTGGTCRAELRVRRRGREGERANLRLIQFVAQLIFIIAVVLAERKRRKAEAIKAERGEWRMHEKTAEEEEKSNKKGDNAQLSYEN